MNHHTTPTETPNKIPEALTHIGNSIEDDAYTRGWNDCRRAMLLALKHLPQAEAEHA
ncbi:hypothetical protein [Candidimonas nitroreducens]|uniref:hypothetical protein n=1 Tax=Candidimonas nitroreducens TaxID=683354 RepID=UPI0013030BFC|nr:hypothetical protein [Candidimonas nitroreducens]